MSVNAWRIWIDTGGTFTDCISTDPSGKILRLKVLSSSLLRVPIISVNATVIRIQLPLSLHQNTLRGYKVRIGKSVRLVTSSEADGNLINVDRPVTGASNVTTLDLFTEEEVPVFAARLLTQTPIGTAFPALEMKLGSTRGTNALLEKKGARTALLVTKGFKDLLVIGNQQRPDLFSLSIKKPDNVYQVVLEINERITGKGEVLTPLIEDSVSEIVKKLRRNRVESVAVALLNSYANPVHELLLGRLLAAAGFNYVSLSHELSGQLKILPRAQTSVVNAYLDPVVRQYLNRIRKELNSASIKVMSSAGGLLELDNFQPKDSLLSGPAGGVVGALEKARLSGENNIITFDMGGTSTDVSRCANKLDYQFECVVGGQRILSPSLAIETIATGGGSICSFDGYQLLVGPQSAGANPGPACYGKGGPLTVTDINLLLARVSAAYFAIPIDVIASDKAADALHANIISKGKRMSKREMMLSLIEIANEKMAEAIRKISVQKGHDPGEYSLLCFGGAGGQHACALATLLEMKKIIVPYDAGLLSAFGIGAARMEHMREKLLITPLDKILPELEDHFSSLVRETDGLLPQSNPIEIERLIFLRLGGQETSLEVTVTDPKLIVGQFKRRYKEVYGHYLPHRPIEVESIRVLVREGRQTGRRQVGQLKRYSPKESEKTSSRSLKGSRQAVYIWESLKPGAYVKGPALVISRNSTTYVEKDWSFELDRNNNGLLLPLKAQNKSDRKAHVATAANLTLFTNRFTSLVEDMGSLLQRSSFSVNVKERLDFSCALLDADGYLIVNAPHIPVHLGSLGVCVREVKKVVSMQEGDVIITNHPAFGGSHLPDITLIKPVYFKGALIGYVVNRAHHAEIGGKKPGSMPADAKVLEEEGVIIHPTHLVRRGVPQWGSIERLLKDALYPSRSPDENLADLNGGLAALMLGASGLEQLCRNHTRGQVTRYMREIRLHAASLMHRKILLLRSRYQSTEFLDDGSKLQVSISKRNGTLLIDFTGTGKVHPGNLNATVAIVNSVVLYVLRLLVGEVMPLNEGLFEHVRLLIPMGMLNPDFSTGLNRSPITKSRKPNAVQHSDHQQRTIRTNEGPAVVGGNTEVSQRLTDTLLKAFGLVACSQGTMNNLLFGNERFGYYETICGGAGATSYADGADAVHTHMTNTRITDPEILELKYPVRLEEFSVRKNSGGKGKRKGGNGVKRVFLFNDALEVNILSQHRNEVPYGVAGGHAGSPGRQQLVSNGEVRRLKGTTGFSVKPGDKLIIETPGGGGWGKPG
ncbi:hydantoinase B/oxoprolinase family protein [Chryseolinea sp. T2]|uniref:hydantoinase B/oxoprolinase family protein n=1 Tax=Chryseolinea sp. T2 TaxID=3129255 RepID=UPI0030788174